MFLNSGGDCLPCLPLQKCGAGVWEQAQKLPVLSWIAKKHADRLSSLHENETPRRTKRNRSSKELFFCKSTGCDKAGYATARNRNAHMAAKHEDEDLQPHPVPNTRYSCFSFRKLILNAVLYRFSTPRPSKKKVKQATRSNTRSTARSSSRGPKHSTNRGPKRHRF